MEPPIPIWQEAYCAPTKGLNVCTEFVFKNKKKPHHMGNFVDIFPKIVFSICLYIFLA